MEGRYPHPPAVQLSTTAVVAADMAGDRCDSDDSIASCAGYHWTKGVLVAAADQLGDRKQAHLHN